MKRGVLYIVWGEKIEPLLKRSMDSVRRFYPDMPIEVVRADPALGLLQKSRMGSLTPFESTLFLDADTEVIGNLDYAFDRAEEYGLACSICECPWMRRYGDNVGDLIEYNSGVLFFSGKSRPVFDAWQELSPVCPSRSRWIATDGTPRGLEFEDQSGFARAVRQCAFNPYVLAINYNFRPGFYSSFFAPLKIWHDPREVPAVLKELSIACETGKRPVQYVRLGPRA